MKINKGDRWIINTSGAAELEIEALSTILTNKDSYKKVKIIRGEQKKRNGTIFEPGDVIEVRTTRTEWVSKVEAGVKEPVEVSPAPVA